jgi:sugar lactone lactonase YvrE
MRCCPAMASVVSAACSLTFAALSMLGAALVPAASAQSAPRTTPPVPARIAAMASLRAHADASQPVVAAPVLSLAQGSYSGPQTVTVTDATPGVTMYYTTNGTSPTTSSPQYNGSITISRSCTLVVLATLSGYQSNDSWAAYYITSVPDSFVYTVAGAATGYGGDGGPATQALLTHPADTAIDASGNLYIADTGNNVIRRIDATTGIITTIAGTGTPGYAGDNGPATAAELDYPISLAFDSAGNLYIGEADSDVRKIEMSTGTITTYAGSQSPSGLGDGGPATSASIPQPQSLAFDSSDNLYILSLGNGLGSKRVREVNAKTQVITTVAGGGATYPPANGDPATSVSIPSAQGMAVDAAGDIYITDSGGVVWQVTHSTGNIGIFAGTFGSTGNSGDGGPATSAKLFFPVAVTVGANGDVYISDSFSGVIRKVDASTGDISTVAGNGNFCFAFLEVASAALSSEFCFIQNMHFDAAGNLYYSSGTNGNTVSELTAVGTPPSTPTPDPTFSLPAGAYTSPQSLTIGDTASGASTSLWVVTNPPSSYKLNPEASTFLGTNAFYAPIGVAGPANVYAQAVAPGHTPSNIVSAAYTYSAPPASLVSTVAGGGTNGFSGQGGPATQTEIGTAGGIAMDTGGNLFIADNFYNVVWKVDASGLISIVAGTGTRSYTGDNGPATAATLNDPSAVVVDSKGNIFIADASNNVVREVLAGTGNIVTYAGDGQSGDHPAGGGPATSTSLWLPSALALDSNSNLYITSFNNVVYEVTASTGIIQIVAGSLTPSGLGDGGPATSAALGQLGGIALDSANNLYIADFGDSRVREVNAKSGLISTVAGNGMAGFGSAGLATSVPLTPDQLAFDGNGNLFVTTGYDVRRVDAKTNTISTVAGIDYNGDEFDPESASMTIACPYSVLADSQSNIYFSDGCKYSVRKITFNLPAAAPTFNPPAGTYGGAQSVSISDTAAGATIYYTTDGSTPTTSSTAYSGAITVSSSETIKAIAAGAGYGQSSVASAAYVILTVPTIALTSSVNPAGVGQAVTFTATLTSSAGTPTGTVAFFDGTTKLGTGTLAAGVATYATSSLAVGAHAITAQYSGDANFAAVTSTALGETVVALSIGPAAGAPTTGTGAPGGLVTYTLSVTPPGTSAVTFAITGLPAGFTATFTPNTVAAGAGPTDVELTINIPAQAVSSAQAPARPGSSIRTALALGLLLLPLLGVGRRGRRLGRMMVLVVLAAVGLVATAGLSGCSHQFASYTNANGNPPPPGSYALTVTATAGSATQSTNLTLNVQ